MKRLSVLALAIAISAGMVWAEDPNAQAHGQENVAFRVDQPDWIPVLVQKLKAAKLWQSEWPESEYGYALAWYAAYRHTKTLNQNFETALAAVEALMDDDDLTPEEREAILAQLRVLRESLNEMKQWGDLIASTRKNLVYLEPQLTQLGIDVERLKEDLVAMFGRVEGLEKHGLTGIQINGSLDLWLHQGLSLKRRVGLAVDGRPVGINGRPASGFHDLSIFHELGLSLSGGDKDSLGWKATLVQNNLFYGSTFGDPPPLQAAFPNMSQTFSYGALSEGSGATTIHELSVFGTAAVRGKAIQWQAGRIGKAWSPYLFRRPDVTPYFDQERWDNGEWRFDGVSASSQYGRWSWDAFAGRQSSLTNSLGSELNPMTAGRAVPWVRPGNGNRPLGLPLGEIRVDQHLGLRGTWSFNNATSLSLSHLILDSNQNTTLVLDSDLTGNRVAVFGAEAKFALGEAQAEAGWAKTNINQDSRATIKGDNEAFWGVINLDKDRWGGHFGYRNIEPLFLAPGSWGRIGTWWNPTDIEGWQVGGWLQLGPSTVIRVDGEFLHGTGITPMGVQGLLSRDTICHWTAEVEHQVRPNWTLSAGYEDVQWDLASRPDEFDERGAFTGGRPWERWFYVGVSAKLSDSSWFHFRWEQSDANTKGLSGWSYPIQGTRASGGLITTQLSIRF